MKTSGRDEEPGEAKDKDEPGEAEDEPGVAEPGVARPVVVERGLVPWNQNLLLYDYMEHAYGYYI